MMHYRAELLGVPNLERPIQIFSITITAIEAWAQTILTQHYSKDQYPEAYVAIYETKEVLLLSRKHKDYGSL